MISNRTIASNFIFSIIATILFSKESIGLNLFIFEICFLLYVISRGEVKFETINQITCVSGYLLSSIFVVITNSSYSIIINFISLAIFAGILIYPESKSLVNTFGLSFNGFSKSQATFVSALSGLKFGGRSVGKLFKAMAIYALPVVIVFFFISLYRISNPVFDNIVEGSLSGIADLFNSVFYNLDISVIMTFIVALITCNFILIRTRYQWIVDQESMSSDKQVRIRFKWKRKFGFLSLKKEYRSAIILFVMLNVVLLLLNVIDIYWVWFNFEWEGKYLKQFVHAGTYILFLSILISIVLVLYYFRNNLNFYPGNKILKILCYIWLIQNGILAISVAIRNFRYIEYFALAYKRIGVVMFLILVLYGLYTVLIKVYKTNSSYYLLRKNAYFLFVVLLLTSFVNWDKIIVKYNFAHANNSFLHLNYLATLSDQVLPELIKPINELKAIDDLQKKKFPFETQYMTPEKYSETVNERIIEFNRKWESKSILSWNLPDHLAYKKLKTMKALK